MMRGIGKLKGQKMPKISAILVCLFVLVFGSKAQKVDSSLISRFRPGFMWFYSGIRSSKFIDVVKYDRLMIDFVYCNWSNRDLKLFTSKWNSIGFNVQSFYDIPFNQNNTIGLGIGLGFGRIKIAQTKWLQHTDNATILSATPVNSGIERFFFTSNRIFVPIELRFRSAGWRHAKVQIGGRLGYQFLARSHIFSENSAGLKVESIAANLKDFNPFLMSVHARIGIRSYALTASYNLNPYFKNKQSTQLNGFELGLSISIF